MDPVIQAFATALVAAIATDSWQQARTAVVTLMRRMHKRQPDDTGKELEGLRERVLAARAAGQADTERALERVWEGRLQELLLEHPELAADLRKILDEILAPMLPSTERDRVARITMTGMARDSSTFNQFVGDQHNVYQQPPSLVPSVACTLPVDAGAFTGRDEQLKTIKTAAVAAAEAGRVVAIHAIDGMPGIGKTTLAVHIGHDVTSLFPDRQLFLDLHAHTPGQQPTDPVDALATLLAADGVDVRFLPSSLEARAAMWRDRMAGKRVLLILDNAASSDQVVPLLPGAAGCLVLSAYP